MRDFDTTVFIVDPDAPVRTALEAALRGSGWATESFSTAEAFLARPPHLAPSCLILELALPDLDGIELLRRMAAERAATAVVVVSERGDVPTTVRAMREGALEFLVKPAADEVLLAAVGQALARSRAALQQEAELREIRRCHGSLTIRERQIMALVVAGYLNKQIAATLGISEITVKAHRGRVMRKMGADSLAGLVGMALQLHIPIAPAARTLAFLRPHAEDRGPQDRHVELAPPARWAIA